MNNKIKSTKLVLDILKLNSTKLITTIIIHLFCISSLFATDYYISTSGNDSNQGTSEGAPWKSLNKINALTLTPGDAIYLKRGDIWTNEFIQINAQGGNSTTRCKLTSYGNTSSPRPVIRRSNYQSDICLQIKNANGWEISEIDFDKAYLGIFIFIDDNLSKSNFYIHDIKCSDMDYASNTTPESMGTGICLYNNPAIYPRVYFSNVRIEDIQTENVFRSLDIYLVQNIEVRKIKDLYGGVGISLSFCENGLLENCNSIGNGGVRNFGTCGSYLYGNNGLTIRNCEFGNAFRGNNDTGDGCGLDFEGENQNVLIDACLFHENEGSGIMLYNAGNFIDSYAINTNIIIKNSIFVKNGIKPHAYNTPSGHIIEYQEKMYHHTGTLKDNRFFINSFCPKFGQGIFNLPSEWNISGNQEMNLLTANNGINSAGQNSSITASSGSFPQNVKDGNESTYWQPNSMTDQWIEFDFGTNKRDINKFIIKQEANYVKRFSIQYRNSITEKWLDCWNGIDMDQIQYCPTWVVNARYVRLYIYNCESSNPRISEIEMYYNNLTDEQTLYSQYKLDYTFSDTINNKNLSFYGNPIFNQSDKKEGKSSIRLNQTDGSFDGAAGIHSDFVAIQNNFSISFWSKPEGTIDLKTESTTGIGGTTGQKYAIFPEYYSQASNEAGAGVSVGTNGISVFEHAGNYMPPLLVYPFPSAKTNWMFITVVYENKKPKLFIDGIYISDEYEKTSTKAYVHPSAHIGDYIPNSGYGRYQGFLDDVRIYKISLSDTQVMNLFRSYSNPYVEYRLENNYWESFKAEYWEPITGITYNADSRGTGGPTFSNSVKKEGLYSARFLTTNYMVINPSALLPIINNFTISFWAKPEGTIVLNSESNSGTAGTTGQKYAIFPEFYSSGDVGAGVSVGTNGISVYELGDNYMPPLLVHEFPSQRTDWIFITVVYDNKTPILYIDGTYINDESAQISSKAIVHPSANVGDYAANSNYGRYIGYIDDIRIYNVAMNKQEVLNLFTYQSLPKAGGEERPEENLPNDFTLSQNFPNPFNPTSTIIYSIKDAGLVTIRVFNILGQEVANLVNETKTPGNYEVIFNAGNLATGVYIYRMHAGEFVETKKMLLIK